jgi:hypothetical protein
MGETLSAFVADLSETGAHMVGVLSHSPLCGIIAAYSKHCGGPRKH